MRANGCSRPWNQLWPCSWWITEWSGDKGRGDVADLLGRLHKIDPDKARNLQDEVHRQTGQRIPFRIAPTRADTGGPMADLANGDSDSVQLPKTNPWGSSEAADRWEAGNMAKVLLGRTDYKDAVKHFAGEFKRDPDKAKPYTAAVYEEMAKSSPKQAVQFMGQMKAAGLVEEKAASGGKVLSAPIPPAANPGQLPPAKPGETDIRIPADSPPSHPSGPGGAVGIAAGQTGMPTVTKNGGIAGGGKSGKVTSPASAILRDATGGARAQGLKPITGTTSVGGSAARAIPFLGTFATFLDFLNFMNSPKPPPPSA